MSRSVLMLSVLAHSLMSAAVDEAGAAAGAAAPAAPERDTAKIRPNLEGYQTVKSASGSSTKICGDEVSKALLGATLDEAYGFVSEVVGVPEADLRAKYSTRNLGQQRMFLGNLIRGAFSGKDTEKATRVSKAFEAALGGFREKIDARLQAEADANQKLKDEKAAARQKAKDDRKAAADKVAQERAEKKAAAEKEREAKKAQKAADKLANDQLREAAKGSNKSEAKQ